jgi:hypothetical protein
VGKKIFKTFLNEVFFYMSPVSTTTVVHLELEMILMGFSEAWGKLIHEKKPEVENLVALSLESI